MSRLWAFVPALVATVALPLLARDIFVTPPDTNSAVIGLYRADPLAAAGTIAGPSGTMMVLRSSANKYYAISRSSLDAVVVLEGTFPSLTAGRRINLPQAPVTAAISPDGRRLVVVAGRVHIIDTATDSEINTSGFDAGSSPTSVAISPDSSRAFVLSSNTQRLTAFDLNTGSTAGSQTLTGGAARMALGPNGMLYVSAPNRLFEYDPRTLTSTAEISMNAFPGQISFTPDGRFALLTNSDARTGSSLIAVDLVRRTTVTAPVLGQSSTATEIVAVSNTTAYAYSAETGRLYRIQLTAGSDAPLTPQSVAFGSVQLEGIRDIAPSNEVQPRYLLVTSTVGLFRVDAQTGSVTGPINISSVGDLSVTSAPTTVGASTVTVIQETRTLGSGQTSGPLVVRVTDASGNPVSGAAVTWTATNNGVISNSMAVTNNQGVAVAYVTSPTGFNGQISVSAAVAGVSAPGTFAITVGTGTGGGTGGVSGLRVVQGSGQALGQFQTTQTNEELQVQLRDAAGQPVSGATVSWALGQGVGSISPQQSVTNENGIARANFISGNVQLGLQYVTNIVTATAGGESINLYVTTLPNLPQSQGSLNAYPRQSTSVVLTARAGETLPGAIKYDVVSPTGARLPFIGIRAVSEFPEQLDPQGRPVVECRGGTQLSDAEGVASCDLVVGNVVGEIRFDVYVGGRSRIERYTVLVTGGLPATVRAGQGQGQSGTPGQRLPLALVAEVVDAFGNPLGNTNVQWDVVSGSATLSEIATRTDVNGRASAVVTLGQTAGPVQVRVRPVEGTGSAVFNLTVNAAATQLERVAGGDNQTAITGQPFGQPLQVRLLNAQGQPVAGAQVNFTVTSGSATVNTAVATTDANGVASTSIAAGGTAGAVVVTAQFGNLTQSFNLTVRTPGPAFNASNVLNGASFQPGISPGSIAVITGTGFAPTLRGTATPQTIVGPLPYRLSDVEVTFNNIPAPIYSVTNNNGQEQVVVQVPYEVSTGLATVTIRSQGGGSTTVSGVQIQRVSPGIFTFTDTNGQRYAVAVRPDGSYINAANPARRGEVVRIFATGLGAVAPASGTNRLGLEGQNVVAPMVAGINDRGTRLVSAQLLPGTIGVYVVALEIPADTEPGPARNLAIAVDTPEGGRIFGNGTSIAIQ